MVEHEDMFSKPLHCNDCSSPVVNWASLNRGALLCNDCCAIHLCLGRHISEIKILKGDNWRGKQYSLMQYLYNKSAHLVWNKSTTSLVPKINDLTDSIREQNIIMKYSQPNLSKNLNAENQDVNMQFLACVRTSHVEITLRLLSLGARTSFIDKDTGNTCLHIAAREGQDLQVELLFLFGADPNARNKNGVTPSQAAACNNHASLANRLIEMKNHLIQEIKAFVNKGNNTKTLEDDEHQVLRVYLSNQSMKDSKLLNTHLRGCNEKQFIRILQDIYDEVERRKILMDWKSLPNGKFFIEEKKTAAFLPSVASYSPTHNQYRQKLAKLSSEQFVLLILQVLKAYKRRSTLEIGRKTADDTPSYGIKAVGVRKSETDSSNIRHQHISSNNVSMSSTSFATSSGADSFIEATEKLTADIRYLVKATQNDMTAEIAESHATKIGESVFKLIKCISIEFKNERVVQLTDILWDSVALLSCKCNSPFLKSEEICAAAFDLAQATKNLLSFVNQ
ncbi:unnamed protein product [Auanema sp. JU1783]|nr:unnamed protein product [Auanema sp. JU1783]